MRLTNDDARSAETIRLIEQSAGRIATVSVARMDERLSWFRALPADQRSWVALVAQAGVASFVEWLRSPDEVLRLTGEVFAAAPRAMARMVTLQQTVELVRVTIAVAEEQIPQLLGPSEDAVRLELLRFSREIAFAAARVYARAAESRGAWDTRLEALLIDGLVRDSASELSPASQIAALGWRSTGPVTAVVGAAPDRPVDEVLADARQLANQLSLDVLAGVLGGRLVMVLGSVAEPLVVATEMLPAFGDGPVVVGPLVADVDDASTATRSALSGLAAARAWPGAPRPVATDSLLPERALNGDAEARATLIDNIYRPLVEAGDVLVETVATFLANGAALESTARALFVHTNTVRYRLRRASEVCGESPTDPRGAFIISLALALGRLDAPAS
ncbi:PucR C-terminal helix-turn-helix domain-containing protein [Frankineae bacterium MT45]|nr:PucR C-terminal helix-turn-helix domain-containing protein [Frankineae bacterium MT45]